MMKYIKLFYIDLIKFEVFALATDEIHIKSLGDSALVVQLDDEVSKDAHMKVMSFVQAVEGNPFVGFLEAVPTYNNVTIFYNPVQVYNTYRVKRTVFETVSELAKRYVAQMKRMNRETVRLVEVPVLYGGEYGPDLQYVARINHLDEEDVISIHSSTDYLVYMIGFAPGFPFLGGMDERISSKRKDSPRASVSAGSVGIAGKQTGIYPFESPGGWQIIGRSPMELFLPKENPPTLIQPGDKLRFVPVDEETYAKVEKGVSRWQS